MIVLKILLGLALVLLVLLLAPASVRLYCDEENMQLRVRYLFFSLNPLSQKEKPEKERPEKVKKKKKKKKAPEEKEAAAKESLQAVWSLLKSSRRALRWIRKHLVFRGVKVFVSVGGEDAHQAAQSYGRLAAALFPALGAASQIFVIKEPVVYIAPDFLSDKTRYEISFRASIRPLFVFVALTTVLGSVVKLMAAGAPNPAKKSGDAKKKTCKQGAAS